MNIGGTRENRASCVENGLIVEVGENGFTFGIGWIVGDEIGNNFIMVDSFLNQLLVLTAMRMNAGHEDDELYNYIDAGEW